VRAVRRSESVVDVEFAERSQLAREVRIVGFLFGVKAHVFQHDGLSVAQRRDRALGGRSDAIVGESDRALWGPISDRIKQKLGRAPDAFAFASYDAITVAYRALAKKDSANDFDALKEALTATAADYRGLTGLTTLNAAGDRASGNYDFWSVCLRAGEFVWVRTVAYVSASGAAGQITRPEGC